MRIQHNIAALNSYRNLTNNNSAVSKNLEKLSSGYKINRAGDDAAGLAISEKMRAQITGLETAQKNANDGISLVQTAEGALTEVHSMLNRMVELADQSANGTYQDAVDRENLQKEVQSLKDEIDRISESTNFNGIQLLDGSMDGKGKAQAAIAGLTNAALVVEATGAAGVVGEYSFDLDGIQVDTEGQALITIAGVTVNIDVTEADSAESIAQKIAAAYNGLAADAKIEDNIDTDSYFIATSQGSKVVFTASAAGAGSAGQITGNLEIGEGRGMDAPGRDLTLQIGDTAASFNQMTVSVKSMSTESLGIQNIDISSQSGAKAAIDVIKSAINQVSSTRGDLGAVQNRLEHTINNLSVTTENMTAAESRIRDVDMAEEMMAYTKNNILVQSSQAMLAQANQIPQGVLQLLQ
ncbi:MAG TPA: flagellin [Candidatus Mediterraneibacter pullistercoris]|nr:flagellin [Candidatus Mediterraneibacter pullistercoris]